jgi:hypothetical protein
MDSFVSNYTSITTAALAGIQKLGLVSIPLIIGIAALVNFFGGERAIRAVGGAIATVVVLAILLENAAAFSSWATGLIGGPH